MTFDITLEKTDEVFMSVYSEADIAMELSEFFTFEVPGARFTPQYRAKMWDGKLRLFNAFTKQLYLGLIPYIEEFCKGRNYSLDNKCPSVGEKVTDFDLGSFIADLKIHSRGTPIEVRDYQQDAVRHALAEGRTLLLSPTASGKSLIIYLLVRWYQNKGYRQLIVVPTTSLVDQLSSDFGDYASELEWTPQDNIAKIYGGQEKHTEYPIVISTWQSIFRMPKSFFNEFDVIYGDECHLFKAKSLVGILTKSNSAKHRIGTTGTLDGTKTHRLVLEGLFGSVHKVTTTKKLMDAKQLATLNIKTILLTYPDVERKLVKKMTYAEELDFIVTHPKRNKFIRNLSLDLKGNTLILFQFVEKHGKTLYEMLKEKNLDGRKIFFVHGGVGSTDREAVRAIVEGETNAIIVASVGVFSTGVNIRNLHNIVFASPSKARIRTLQSIGRGLRTDTGKTICNLYDIGDDFAWKSTTNYTLTHMKERIKIYNQEGFNYKIITIPLYGN